MLSFANAIHMSALLFESLHWIGREAGSALEIKARFVGPICS